MTAPSKDTVLHRIGEVQAHLPGAVSVMIGVAALGAVTLPGAWPMTRHVGLIAHEGAHAVMGSSLGHRVIAMRLQRDGNGGTVIAGITDRGSGIAVGLIGYLGPSLAGLGAAKLIGTGHIVAVLWLELLALAILLPLLRTAFGVISVLGTGGLLFLLARSAPLGAQTVTAYATAWYLLLAGVRMVLEDGSGADDAGKLRGLTRIPPGFWSRLWLLGAVTTLAIGGSLLV